MAKFFSSLFLGATLAILALPTACQSKQTTGDAADDLIPRSVLFGNPDIARVRLSPDGKYVAYLSEHQGVLNVWIQEFGKPETKKVVTNDSKRGIFSYDWTFTPGVMIFRQDVGGDENFGVYALNVTTGETTEVSAPGKSTSNLAEVSHQRPHEVVIMSNERDPKYFDYKILNLKTKKQTVLFQNTFNYSGVIFDRSFRPVLATLSNSDGSESILLWKARQKKFVKTAVVPFEDAMSFAAFGVSGDGKRVFLIDSRGQDKAALKSWNLQTNQQKVLSLDEQSDIQRVQLHPQTDEPMWATSEYLTTKKHFLDRHSQTHVERIEKQLGAPITVTSMSLDGQHWSLVPASSNKVSATYFYDLKSQKLSEPMYLSEALRKYENRLNAKEAVEIKSRDGLSLVSYLTKSPRQVDQALVLLVHGGPWSRDNSDFGPSHQWLSDRGYNVLSVNFRGSTGFGKKFLNAGDLEWGKKMHTDLLDAVQWAIDNGYTRAGRVVIMGGSYGGYSALAGLTFSPDTFAAAVDIVGPSNLETLLATVPPYWESMRTTLYRRVGNPTTPEGLALLRDRSPLNHVDKIKRPLLILQGANDPRVKKAEADQIFNAMLAKKIPVEYVLFPDEGHGFARAQNSLGSNAVIERFLKMHLGGRLQPIDKDVAGSNAQFITTKQ